MYERTWCLPLYLVPLLIGLCVIHGPPWCGNGVRAAHQDILYTDDEDLEHPEFSGSGDSQNIAEESTRNFTSLQKTGHLNGKGVKIKLKTDVVTELLQVGTRKPWQQSVSSSLRKHKKGEKGKKGKSPVEVKKNSSSKKKKKILTKVKLSKLQSSKQKKSRKQAKHLPKGKQKSRKQPRVKHKNTKVRNIFRKSPKKKVLGRTRNLHQATHTLTLSDGKQHNTQNSVIRGHSKDHHIKYSSGNKNSHQSKRQNGYKSHHNQKRWQKNKSSNRHGYGKTGDPGKKLTFEDRWPGCFSKYQSCFRNSNCCRDYCHHFTWLHFGFCL